MADMFGNLQDSCNRAIIHSYISITEINFKQWQTKAMCMMCVCASKHPQYYALFMTYGM